MTDHRGKDPIDHLRISANECNVVASSVVRAALAQVAEIVASRDRLAAYVRLIDRYIGDIETYREDHDAIEAARAALDEHGDLGA